MAVGVSATSRYCYCNGGNSLVQSTVNLTPSGLAKTLLGLDKEGAYYYPLNGLLDQVEICNEAWSADQVAFDYLNQATAAGGLTWGVEEMPHRFLAGSVGGAGNAVAAGTVIVPLAGAIGGQGNAAVSGSEVGAPPSGGASPVVIGSRVIPMPRHLWSP